MYHLCILFNITGVSEICRLPPPPPFKVTLGLDFCNDLTWGKRNSKQILVVYKKNSMEQTVFELWPLFNREHTNKLTNCGSTKSIRFVDQNLGQPAVKNIFLAVLLYYKQSFVQKL